MFKLWRNIRGKDVDIMKSCRFHLKCINEDWWKKLNGWSLLIFVKCFLVTTFFAFCMFSPAYIGNLSRGRRVYCSPSRRMIASERIHGTNGRMEMRKNMWNRKSPSNSYFFPLFSRKVLLYFILIGQVLTVIFLSIFLGNFMVSNASFCV